MVQIKLVGNKIFRWNLSRNVGLRQPNLVDDVELVRFGYFCASQSAQFSFKFQMSAVFSRLQSTGPYGSDLQDVINAHQRLRGGTQDGIVSVEQNSAFGAESYDAAQNVWIIVALDNNMKEVVDEYPRIDLHPRSGGTVSTTVLSLLKNL